MRELSASISKTMCIFWQWCIILYIRLLQQGPTYHHPNNAHSNELFCLLRKHSWYKVTYFSVQLQLLPCSSSNQPQQETTYLFYLVVVARSWQIDARPGCACVLTLLSIPFMLAGNGSFPPLKFAGFKELVCDPEGTPWRINASVGTCLNDTEIAGEIRCPEIDTPFKPTKFSKPFG